MTTSNSTANINVELERLNIFTPVDGDGDGFCAEAIETDDDASIVAINQDGFSRATADADRLITLLKACESANLDNFWTTVEPALIDCDGG